MLTISDINYDKNYFRVKVQSEGVYLINGVPFQIPEIGIYELHMNYDFIRKLSAGDAIAPEKAPTKKKSSKKSKKNLH